MFTGIVEIIGTVSEYIVNDSSSSGGNGTSITITDAKDILGDCHLGDSIAVNGTCLTVTEFDENSFKVGVSQETLRKTNLGDLNTGSKVNLERAISGDVRFGGHMVQGHVDTIAKIVSRNPDGNSIVFEFELRDKEYINYIVHKGFICIDGTSLTVTNVDYENSRFKIMMVAYTQEKVIMPLKKINDFVNIEVDVTGKLIERQVNLTLEGQLENKESPLVKLISKLIDEKIKSFKN
ncbi:hypothetical protein B5S28_g5005 [[Candida] boidinii]|uniref:Unnamed protein product n=1 Tax=Candida boidinii TaxID=5477 RepID=A0ACB5TWG4_CANBO|nr:hypothetical protein B5S28_g5005 [[Candida] boidinii]OWB62568.1 hypothetical protein B5S29_g3501 [[Candida] boidinii]OWB75443.1 hypothetical protein B5S31_g5343 [[Candida] boidinii]OWB81035.1 hypothetical protein B5S32_g5379 [[Candida] boidinii]GME86166.1 unnamed protein product [[Candida] boidinii]